MKVSYVIYKADLFKDFARKLNCHGVGTAVKTSHLWPEIS